MSLGVSNENVVELNWCAFRRDAGCGHAVLVLALSGGLTYTAVSTENTVCLQEGNGAFERVHGDENAAHAIAATPAGLANEIRSRMKNWVMIAKMPEMCGARTCLP